MKNTGTKYYKFWMIYCLAGMGVLLALGIIISAFIAQGVASSSHGARDFPYIFLPLDIMGGIGIVVIMPIGIYYLIRYRYFSKTEWTDIQEVKLERIYTPWPRILGFEVPMNFGGQSRIVRTFALFTAEWIGPNKLKNYSGQTVRVGYDAAKNKAVVLDTFS